MTYETTGICITCGKEIPLHEPHICLGPVERIVALREHFMGQQRPMHIAVPDGIPPIVLKTLPDGTWFECPCGCGSTYFMHRAIREWRALRPCATETMIDRAREELARKHTVLGKD